MTLRPPAASKLIGAGNEGGFQRASVPLRLDVSGVAGRAACEPNSGGDDTGRVLGDLIEADAGAGRFLACTLYARSGRLSDRVYARAKIGIVDDAWLTFGSAKPERAFALQRHRDERRHPRSRPRAADTAARVGHISSCDSTRSTPSPGV
jgi:hypothetical protein